MAVLETAMAAAMWQHLVLYGANRTGTAIGWLTRWSVTREALVIHTPGEPPLLLVNFYNHVPNATRVATDAGGALGGERPAQTAAEELRRRGAAGARIGADRDLWTIGRTRCWLRSASRWT